VGTVSRSSSAGSSTSVRWRGVGELDSLRKKAKSGSLSAGSGKGSLAIVGVAPRKANSDRSVELAAAAAAVTGDLAGSGSGRHSDHDQAGFDDEPVQVGAADDGVDGGNGDDDDDDACSGDDGDGDDQSLRWWLHSGQHFLTFECATPLAKQQWTAEILRAVEHRLNVAPPSSRMDAHVVREGNLEICAAFRLLDRMRTEARQQQASSMPSASPLALSSSIDESKQFVHSINLFMRRLRFVSSASYADMPFDVVETTADESRAPPGRTPGADLMRANWSEILYRLLVASGKTLSDAAVLESAALLQRYLKLAAEATSKEAAELFANVTPSHINDVRSLLAFFHSHRYDVQNSLVGLSLSDYAVHALGIRDAEARLAQLSSSSSSLSLSPALARFADDRQAVHASSSLDSVAGSSGAPAASSSSSSSQQQQPDMNLREILAQADEFAKRHTGSTHDYSSGWSTADDLFDLVDPFERANSPPPPSVSPSLSTSPPSPSSRPHTPVLAPVSPSPSCDSNALHQLERFVGLIIEWSHIRSDEVLASHVRSVAEQLRTAYPSHVSHSVIPGSLMAYDCCSSADVSAASPSRAALDDSQSWRPRFVRVLRLAEPKAGERRKVCVTLDPLERALGATLEVDPSTLHHLPADVLDEMVSADRSLQFLVYDPISHVLEAISDLIEERVLAHLASTSVDVTVLRKLRAKRSLELTDLPALAALRDSLGSISLRNDAMRELLVDCESATSALVDKRMGSVNFHKMFQPLIEQRFIELNHYRAHLERLLHLRFIAVQQLVNDAMRSLEARALEALDGTQKAEVTDAWLGMIDGEVAEFLRARGFRADAIPDDYIQRPPSDLAVVERQHELISEMLDPNKDLHGVKQFVVQLRGQIYELIDSFQHDLHAVLRYQLRVDAQHSFDLARAHLILDNLGTDGIIDPSLLTLCVQAIGDLEYIEMMRAMEADFASATKPKGLHLSTVVPISGLILAKFHIIEQEFNTVLDVWKPRPKAAAPAPPKRASLPSTEASSSADEIKAQPDVDGVGSVDPLPGLDDSAEQADDGDSDGEPARPLASSAPLDHTVVASFGSAPLPGDAACFAPSSSGDDTWLMSGTDSDLDVQELAGDQDEGGDNGDNDGGDGDDDDDDDETRFYSSNLRRRSLPRGHYLQRFADRGMKTLRLMTLRSNVESTADLVGVDDDDDDDRVSRRHSSFVDAAQLRRSTAGDDSDSDSDGETDARSPRDRRRLPSGLRSFFSSRKSDDASSPAAPMPPSSATAAAIAKSSGGANDGGGGDTRGHQWISVPRASNSAEHVPGGDNGGGSGSLKLGSRIKETRAQRRACSVKVSSPTTKEDAASDSLSRRRATMQKGRGSKLTLSQQRLDAPDFLSAMPMDALSGGHVSDDGRYVGAPPDGIDADDNSDASEGQSSDKSGDEIDDSIESFDDFLSTLTPEVAAPNACDRPSPSGANRLMAPGVAASSLESRGGVGGKLRRRRRHKKQPLVSGSVLSRFTSRRATAALGGSAGAPGGRGASCGELGVMSRSSATVAELIDAAERHDLEQLMHVVRVCEIAVDSIDENGDSALHVAVSQPCCTPKDEQFLKVLLRDLKCDVSRRNSSKFTPLASACRAGNMFYAYTLLQCGANPVDAVPGNVLPMHLLSARAHGSNESFCAAVLSIMASRHSVNALTERKETPLHYAVVGTCNECVIRALLKLGADPNLPNSRDLSPLALCVLSGKISVTQMLLDAGGLVTEQLLASAQTDKLRRLLLSKR
jgi:Ankyrin repeats (3 copies)